MHEPPGMSSVGSLVQPLDATPFGRAGQSPAVLQPEGDGTVQNRSVVYAAADAQMPPPALQSTSERQGEQSVPSPTQVPEPGSASLAIAALAILALVRRRAPRRR